MKCIGKQAFTLVELLVVITIMVMLTLAAYAPYQMYQTKQKVRNSTKIVAQALYDARGMAINGTVDSLDSNVSIGVSIEKGSGVLSIEDINSGTVIEKRELIPGVQISRLHAGGDTDKLLLEFLAITGSGLYKEGTTLAEFTGDKLDIMVGFQGATTGLMTQSVDYYTNTYVADRR